MDLCHLFYQSQALVDFGTPVLAALLRQGRAYNHEHNISGVLLHTPDGRFLHVLEGPEMAVRRLYYYVVLSDTRRSHCQVFRNGPIARRSSARLGDGPLLGSCRRPAHPDG